jgi:hypothetical protein
MMAVLPLDPASYRSHALHSPEREWRETSCSVDLFIEGLHALRCDPVPALCFTLGGDFDGEQWRMLKIPPEDLRSLYGIRVDELNVWMPLTLHLGEHIGAGRMVTIDADAFHLPDTIGVTYGEVHQKTTILVQMIDIGARKLGYFHNSGYHELDEADFDAVVGPATESAYGRWELPTMPPYTEAVRVDRIHRPIPDVGAVAQLLATHLEARPFSNPITRMEKRMFEDLDWLVEHGLSVFHRYAFATLRQCGANAELASSLLDWLGERGVQGLELAAEAMRAVSVAMKGAQFRLARAVARSTPQTDVSLAPAADAWQLAIDLAVERLCGEDHVYV